MIKLKISLVLFSIASGFLLGDKVYADEIPKNKTLAYKHKKKMSIDEVQKIVDDSSKDIDKAKQENDKQYDLKIQKEKEDAENKKKEDEQAEKDKQQKLEDEKNQQKDQQNSSSSSSSISETSNSSSNSDNQQNNDDNNTNNTQVSNVSDVNTSNTDSLLSLKSSGSTPMLDAKLTWYNPKTLGWSGDSIQGGIHIQPDSNGIYKDDAGNIAIAAKKSIPIGQVIKNNLGTFIVVDHSEGNYDLVVNW